MKPLNKNNLSTFLKRFDNFKDAELRSFEVVSANEMKLTLATQDSARAFDWITIELSFYDITDANLIEDNKLHLIDMNDGISLFENDAQFAFAIGECYNISTIRNSILYIICKSLKYKEGSF
ncbi:hypothetical protein [Sulfurimonas sp.]